MDVFLELIKASETQDEDRANEVLQQFKKDLDWKFQKITETFRYVSNHPALASITASE